MICHDDNYTDISRRYGAKSAGIVVVPTNDWAHVRKAHFQNSIHRAIESRFAIVRAASYGISAIISPTGKRLAVSDHLNLLWPAPCSLQSILFLRGAALHPSFRAHRLCRNRITGRLFSLLPH
jgi:hypothetical protein